METKHYFQCDCGCTVISVYVAFETDGHVDDVGFMLYGDYLTSWKARLRHIWSIIKHGHPWGSQDVLLPPEEARRLGQLLLAIANSGTQEAP